MIAQGTDRQFHSQELLLSGQLQIPPSACFCAGFEIPEDELWNDNTCCSHLGQEDDCPGNRRVFPGIIDGGNDVGT